MNNRGMALQDGISVAANTRKALEWFEKSATMGNRVAMRNIGLTYFKGLGIPRDDRVAAEWFEKSAALGEGTAMFYMGAMLTTQKDDVKAVDWFRHAVAA
jgi:TPR repeat protein